ncbi:MAG: YlxM family DNA-binding protein [Clostridia bacterium]|nr:YlxM family DNA-binding protein [Clostridia bacterium]
MKSDTYYMTMLYDFYGNLLTDKQKDLFDLYYNEDLSLSEIADNIGITRQGVRDGIMRSEHMLRDTEDKLGLVKRYSNIQGSLDSIQDAISEIARVNAMQVKNPTIAKNIDIIVNMVKLLSEQEK